MSYEDLRSACLEILQQPTGSRARRVRTAIEAGRDPLGDQWTQLMTASSRNQKGLTLTPLPLVCHVLSQAALPSNGALVDLGCGSGRFTLAAASQGLTSNILAIDRSRLACAVTRANLAASGHTATVVRGNLFTFERPPARGPVTVVGNLPYIRHHHLPAKQKQRFRDSLEASGRSSNSLAGGYVHILWRLHQVLEAGDRGALILPAEWMQSNYGQLVRDLLAGPLGGYQIDRLPADFAFAGVMATATVVCFHVGGPATRIVFRQLRADLTVSRLEPCSHARLKGARNWPPAASRVPKSAVPLGSVFSVKCGRPTGAKRIWIHGDDAPPLPDRFRQPCVTRAKELFEANGHLRAGDHLRRLVVFPRGFTVASAQELAQLHAWFVWARAAGVEDSQTARARDAWWRVRVMPVAPLLVSYTARQKPAVARNHAGARHLNIALGLYPRKVMSDLLLDIWADRIRECLAARTGRVLSGGLEKYEPKDLERVQITPPAGSKSDS